MPTIHALSGPATPTQLYAVLYAGDSAYSPVIAASLRALLHHNPHLPADIYIATDDPDFASKLALPSGCRAAIYRFDIADGACQRLPVPERNSPAVYRYLRALGEFPGPAERILYLDGDTLVVGDLEPLLTWDLDGRAIAAAPDMFDAAESRRHFAALGVDGKTLAFNSGVLLTDRRTWQALKLAETAMAWLAEHGHRAIYADQDALNIACGNDWARLPLNANHQCPWLIRRFVTGRDDGLSAPPLIHHFNCPVKPWHPWAPAPLQEIFAAYSGGSAWYDAISDLKIASDARVERLIGFTKQVLPNDLKRHEALAQSLVAARPRDERSLRYAHEVARQMGDLKRAYSLLEQAASTAEQPAFPTQVNRLKLHAHYERYEAVARIAREALAIHPDEADLYYFLALALSNLECGDEAMEACLTACRLAPGEDSYKRLAERLAAHRDKTR